ncbi:uncharacterized protein LOC113279673 [Papaver somniferum]|uniref:uncharacterized protein LOC113279673 n=1 Tax=Papaver somniferum TaxID=3469 RepID=UPI000E6F4C7E|nr:uncharacterized protein LOC113279673 [Papaver somniferum]
MAWYEKFADALISLDFKPSLADPSLFIIIHLGTLFAIKDLGALHFFLGLQVTRNVKGLFLSQTKYAIDILQKCNIVGIKPCTSPCPANFKLSASDGDLLANPTEYRSLVGSLHYLTWTRPDISFAFNHICQFMHAPTTAHLQAAKRVLRYIKGTLGHGIIFSQGFNALQGYTDVEWAGNPDDRRWSCKLQWRWSKLRLNSVGADELVLVIVGGSVGSGFVDGWL